MNTENTSHQNHEAVDNMDVKTQETSKPAYSKPVLHILATSETKLGSNLGADGSTASS